MSYDPRSPGESRPLILSDRALHSLAVAAVDCLLYRLGDTDNPCGLWEPMFDDLVAFGKFVDHVSPYGYERFTDVLQDLADRIAESVATPRRTDQ